jgi:hypothetical protein
MIRTLFSPATPADELRAERERVARKRPHLALAGADPRPDPDMFRWWSPADLIEQARR